MCVAVGWSGLILVSGTCSEERMRDKQTGKLGHWHLSQHTAFEVLGAVLGPLVYEWYMRLPRSSMYI